MFVEWQALLAGFAISLLLCFLIIRLAGARWMDQPGSRSLHQVPVPRLGGVAVFAGLLLGMVLSCRVNTSVLAFYSPQVLQALGVIFVLAILDDRFSLSPLIRLPVQALAVAWLIVAGLRLQMEGGDVLWWSVLSLVVMLWGINLYNFMDGMDGFAAGMAMIGFSALGLAGWLAGDPIYLLACLLPVAAVAGFWLLNFPPARIFLGDSGSTVLGLLMVVLSLQGCQKQLFPLWLPLLVFSPFWVDASVTLLLRVMRGERFWQAHRQHAYQRLVLAGFTHRRIVLWQYRLMLACAGSALLWQYALKGYNGFALVFCWAVVYVMLWQQVRRVTNKK